MLKQGLVQCDKIKEMFTLIEPDLIRYPVIDPPTFRAAVWRFCDENR